MCGRIIKIVKKKRRIAIHHPTSQGDVIIIITKTISLPTLFGRLNKKQSKNNKTKFGRLNYKPHAKNY
jgi:hypothetical protein